MKLNELHDNKGATKKRMRVGRGIGSGKGKTSGSGQKGQKARTGVSINGFEGGQMPLHMRLPKRGFTHEKNVKWEVVNLSVLQDFVDRKKLDPSKLITSKELFAAGVINKEGRPVRLLAKGEVKSKLELEVSYASESAKSGIEKAGGTLKILSA